ncbi:hypothetical protein [Roseovarius sp. TE539]|uniref:hypothetical protein n=1 Tax=Roseovarius sp. TE539 TaxID=2249812 RepID=UPI0011BDE4CD|nr:hypothetical protein [Roseovarius sp. TE539]
MTVERLRQFDPHRVTLDRGNHPFRLECPAVGPVWSSCHGLRLARRIMPPVRGISTCPGCSDVSNLP